MGIMTTGSQPFLLKGGTKKKKSNTFDNLKNIRSYPKPSKIPSKPVKQK